MNPFRIATLHLLHGNGPHLKTMALGIVVHFGQQNYVWLITTLIELHSF